jgi:phosphotransferase system IIB component
VSQVTEETVSERVISQILDQASTIRVSMRHAQLVFGCSREFLKQKMLNLIRPEQIDDLFMSQHRVAAANLARRANEQGQQQY